MARSMFAKGKRGWCVGSRAIGANKKREYPLPRSSSPRWPEQAGSDRGPLVSVRRKVAHIAPGWNIHSSQSMWLARCQQPLTTLSKGGESYFVLSNDEPPKIPRDRCGGDAMLPQSHFGTPLPNRYLPSAPHLRWIPSISITVLNSTGIDRAELERSSNDGPSEPTAREAFATV